MLTATRNPNLDQESVHAGASEPPLPGDWLLGPRGPDWWTGEAPLAEVCPGVGADGRIDSLPLPNLATCSRRQVLDYFANTWCLTDVLFAALQGEAAFLRPPYHQLRHPMVFYYGHTASLYVNKLRVAGLLTAPVNPWFERIFETGVDEMSWDDMSKNEMQWPAVREVTDYRRSVYRLVRDLIETHPGLADGHPPIGWEHPLWALFLGFEHERIHLETSAVLLRELPLGLLRRPAAWPVPHPGVSEHPAPPPAAAAPELVKIPGGSLNLGKPRDWPGYGWDNEYGERHAEVRPFRCSRQLVSNGDFHAFVAAGGYREAGHWSEAGWRWREFRNAKWPTFWVAHGPAGLHQFRLRTLFEVLEMPWDWPVIVNRHEARAYLAWRGTRDGRRYRLPTEAEHVLMRGLPRQPDEDLIMVRDGRSLRASGEASLNLAHGSEGPVAASAPAACGVHDLMGNLWDWCEDDFHPLPGARVHPYYDDFSTPCYDGEHAMILGGSFLSTGNEASRFARFHFRPHFFQHAGFHLVEPGPGETDSGAVRIDRGSGAAGKYAGAAILDQYLLAHYGPPQDALPPGLERAGLHDFPGRCARLALDWLAHTGGQPGRALDVGCAVGGASFALAQQFGEVTGVDLSETFIQAARHLGTRGELHYHCPDQGELRHPLTARVALAALRGAVTFRRADACALPPEYADFDVVLAANLLDRLPSPKALLGRLGGPRGLVRPGGILVLTTPYTWREEFTPREAWLGGFEGHHGAEDSHQGLSRTLGPEFDLLHRQDLPLVLREHARKFEYVVADATVWRRRG
jgi:5-histidylcysteine sulfoxide synthase/putative 4-mercaptohistidine N1-methyltranferase